jgi:acyl carrier protein
MSQTQDIEGDIKRFVAEQVLDDPTAEVDARAPLLQGMLDSWALMQLISFLEERFGIDVQPDDVVDEHFGSVASVSNFVTTKANATT